MRTLLMLVVGSCLWSGCSGDVGGGANKRSADADGGATDGGDPAGGTGGSSGSGGSSGTGGSSGSGGTGGSGGSGGSSGSGGGPCTLSAECDDNNFCNGAEECNAGTCESVNAPCAGQTCDETSDSCKPVTADVTISVDPSTTFQTMSGWEATAQAGQDPGDTPITGNNYTMYRDTLMDAAVNSLGLNRLRLEIFSGAENTTDYWAQKRDGLIDSATFRANRYLPVNDDNDPDTVVASGFQFSSIDNTVDRVVLPMKAAVEANGETLFINLCYVDFRSVMNHAHDSAAEYAEFMLVTTDHLKTKYGFEPDAWEMILEPDNTTTNTFTDDWWLGTDVLSNYSGTKIGNVMVATASRLSAAGYTPRLIAPSTTGMSVAPTLFDDILAVPGAVDDMIEIAYHRYKGVGPAALDQIKTRAATNGLQTSMLEHIESHTHYLHSDLTLGNASAWQKFALAFPGSSPDNHSKYFNINTSNPSNLVIEMTPYTRTLRQYFRWVRLGAVRIGTSTASAGGLRSVAFTNANGKTTVAIDACSDGSTVGETPDGPDDPNDCAATTTVALSGLPAATYGVNHSTATTYDVDGSDIVLGAGQVLTVDVPRAAVLTVYAK